MKQKVHVETSDVSYLASRPARDVVVAAHQELTREWWDERSSGFELVISELVEQEAGAGDSDASRFRLAAIQGIPTAGRSHGRLRRMRSISRSLPSTA